MNRKLIATLTILIVVLSLIVIASCVTPSTTPIPTSTPTVEEMTFGVRGWDSGWATSVRPTATYVVPANLATVTPHPFTFRDEKFPRLYGIYLGNIAHTQTVATPPVHTWYVCNEESGPSGLSEFELWSMFDIMEVQYDIGNANADTFFADCFSGSVGTPTAPGGIWENFRTPVPDESVIDYAQHGVTDDTFWFAYTYHIADADFWKITNKTPVAQMNAPTSTPTPGGSWVESPNYDDLYMMRRVKGWKAAGEDTTADCNGWLSCGPTGIYIEFEDGAAARDEIIYNAYNSDGAQTVGGETYAEWSCGFIDDTNRSFDGIRDDVMTNHMLTYTFEPDETDFDNDSDTDYDTFGFPDSWQGEYAWENTDRMYAYGRFDWANCIRNDGTPLWGNGAWEPAWQVTGTNSHVFPAMGSVDGVMLEQIETDLQEIYWWEWDSYTSSTTGISCGWDCVRKIVHGWQDEGRGVVFLGRYVSGVQGTYGDEEDQARYNFVSTSLQDAYVGWTDTSYGRVNWHDFYSISLDETGNCDADYTTSGLHWLGDPVGEAKIDGDGGNTMTYEIENTGWESLDTELWGREFDFGYIAVNPTGTSGNITLPGTDTYKYVEGGGGSQATVSGSTITVPAYQSRILCNTTTMSAGFSPGPAATNTPVIATPTRPPVGS